MGNGALPNGPSYRAHPRLYLLGSGAMADFDRDDGLCKLQLDRDVRDFLLTALRKI